MIKKLLIGLVVGLIILALVFLGVYYGFNAIIMKSELSNVKEYKLIKDEKVTYDFKYDKYKYVVSSYKTPEMKYSTNNYLLEYLGKYYYLDSYTDCDMTAFAKDNFLYTHCANYSGNIVKFKFYGTRVFNELIELSYHKAPNIDQKNVEVYKVTDDSLYLKSNKVDESIPEGDKVKCDLDTSQCEYVVEESKDKEEVKEDQEETKKETKKESTKKKDTKKTDKDNKKK